MIEESHTLPAVDVQQLVPEGSREVQLLPETPVLCIHRGRNPTVNGVLQPLQPRRGDTRDHSVRQEGVAYVGDYVDTWDSKHYVIAPGYFVTPLGAAVHFKARAVVPGSRNPETNFQASFLSIIGVVTPQPDGGYKVVKAVDDPADWDPFTDEECGIYEIAFEALDRANMQNAIEPEVELRRTTGGAGGGKPSRVRSGGKVGGPRGKGTKIETTDDEILTPIPPSENSTLRQIDADRQAAASGKGDD